MDIKNIYHIAQRAMGAQLVRLNATASNLANADNIASSPQDAYKPVKPIFETKYFDLIRKRGISTVDAVTVQKMDVEPIKEYKPGHPLADENGFTVEIYQSMNSDSHKWYFYPKMNRDEVVMFKTYDSNENPFMPTLHSAFDDLSCNSKVSPRESIEVRAICLFD